MKKILILLPILFLWFPNVSHAAIARDNSVILYSNAGNASASFTISGSNRFLYIGCEEAGQTISSITVNGSATGITLLHHQSGLSGTFSDQYDYYLVAPPTGSVTVAVNVSASSYNYCGAVSYTGVNQSTPIDVSGINNGTSITSLTSTLTTTVANDWLIEYAGIETYDTSVTAGAGTVAVLLGPSSPNYWYGFFDSGATLSTGSNSLVVNRGTASNIYTNIVAIEPVAPITLPSILASILQVRWWF